MFFAVLDLPDLPFFLLYLHLFSFKTPTLLAVMSEKGGPFCAFWMRKCVQCCFCENPRGLLHLLTFQMPTPKGRHLLMLLGNCYFSPFKCRLYIIILPEGQNYWYIKVIYRWKGVQFMLFLYLSDHLCVLFFIYI